MNISAKKQWNVYNKSKEAQMINVCPRLPKNDPYTWQDVLAFICGAYIGLVAALCVILIPFLIVYFFFVL
jgi:hypothetical protein